MRRICLPTVSPGSLSLPRDEAHHVRDVLRLQSGDTIEVFDPAGQVAQATIIRCDASDVIVDVGEVRSAPADAFQWTIASAIPKGPRADWMIEKLSELGTAEFVPLKTARSVVVPEGPSKYQRWQRLAAESAKQSRRSGVMSIGELVDLNRLLGARSMPGWYLSTDSPAISVDAAARAIAGTSARSLLLLIGPEGGWTQAEMDAMAKAGLTAVSLGATILRVETAAVTAAAIVAAIVAPALAGRQDAQP